MLKPFLGLDVVHPRFLRFFVILLLFQTYSCDSCGGSKKRLLNADDYAADAAPKLAKCCCATGEYEVAYKVLGVDEDRRGKRFKIKMEITWKEAKLLGAGQVLKGILHVDFNGCNPVWEKETSGYVPPGCWKSCFFDCLNKNE